MQMVYFKSGDYQWLEFHGQVDGLQVPEMIRLISDDQLVLYFENDSGHFEYIYTSVKSKGKGILFGEN